MLRFTGIGGLRRSILLRVGFGEIRLPPSLHSMGSWAPTRGCRLLSHVLSNKLFSEALGRSSLAQLLQRLGPSHEDPLLSKDLSRPLTSATRFTPGGAKGPRFVTFGPSLRR